MSIVHVTKENFNELIKGDKPVLMDFFATWCGPCKMLGPILEQLADETDKIIIAKCDIDECMEFAQQYNIMSVPTLLVFKDGTEMERAVGFRQKAQLLDLISKYAE